MLIPLSGTDGSELSARALTKVKDVLNEAFGGHTIAGTVTGAYRMNDGSIAEDVSLEVWVAVNPDRVDEVRQIASDICRELEQESIYFEVTDSEVEFVCPSLFDG